MAICVRMVVPASEMKYGLFLPLVVSIHFARLIETESQQWKTKILTGSLYSHPHGCSQLGDDQLHTQKILCGLIPEPECRSGTRSPGWSCENNQVELLKKVLGAYDENAGEIPCLSGYGKMRLRQVWRLCGIFASMQIALCARRAVRIIWLLV